MVDICSLLQRSSDQVRYACWMGNKWLITYLDGHALGENVQLELKHNKCLFLRTSRTTGQSLGRAWCGRTRGRAHCTPALPLHGTHGTHKTHGGAYVVGGMGRMGGKGRIRRMGEHGVACAEHAHAHTCKSPYSPVLCPHKICKSRTHMYPKHRCIEGWLPTMKRGPEKHDKRTVSECHQ